MIIDELRLSNYRRFKDIQVSFAPGVNVITGPTGSGKTTIIEAIGFTIYGETFWESNLSDIIRYGTTFCNMKLSLSNSKQIEIVREIKKSAEATIQKIIFNGDEVKKLDISGITDMFLEKELFYRLVSVDPYRQSLSDINRQVFRNIFSKHISSWDIQRVLNNSKSLRVHLRLREEQHSMKVKDIQSLLSKQESLVEKLKASLDEEQNLKKGLKSAEEKVRVIEEEISQNMAYNRSVLSLLENFEKNLKNLRPFSRRLRRSLDQYKEIRDSLWRYEKRHPKYLDDYFEKIDFIYRNVQELSDVSDQLFELREQTETNTKRMIIESEQKLHREIDRKNEIMMRLDQISRELTNYEKQGIVMQEMKIQLEKSQEELEKYRSSQRMEEGMEILIRNLWRKQFTKFFSKVKDKINQYLKNMTIDMQVVIEEEQMKALINGGKINFDFLSAGEKSLLNLLVRISLTKELGESSILILDYPIAFLDQEKATEVFSLLSSLKDDFGQIIIATQREDLPIIFDKKITLTR